MLLPGHSLLLLQKPKWGWVSTQPGTSMEFVVNTKLVKKGPHCPLCKANPLLASLLRLCCKHAMADFAT